ncbi:replication protein A 32 kDa subunit-like [Xyrichtys novacula]|uniref:Replication protein A 32 kDa subunit-like n=1 Tax=Xyrichtys novacula TaxID=13765 RepID=A0AAV1HD20_XYRNO|nr:replication protein A 32 kDa subunit-like [Xyrichtys novacula]
MWNQACSQSPAAKRSHKGVISKSACLQILPCTVSQLLSASPVSKDSFAFCDLGLNQVSVVGIIRRHAPFKSNIQYSVDDMTGPPLNVKQWINSEESSIHGCGAPMSPGTYVKVIGNLRNSRGQRTLLVMNIRSIEDLNEITSHMLEVVQAHMHIFGKAYDVNMNITAAGPSTKVPGNSSIGEYPEDIFPNDVTEVQDKVYSVIRKFSVQHEGIGLNDLKGQLEYISMRDIRRSLAFLFDRGHIFSTIDEHHFKSTEY